MIVRSQDMLHLDYVKTITDGDYLALLEKEATYRGSWKKRGGVGAFMMLARKWDRIENMMEERRYDVFEQPGDGGDGTLIAEVRDLRRYLVLVEAELTARGEVPLERTRPLMMGAEVFVPGTPEDGGQHESVTPWATPVPTYGDWQEKTGGLFVLKTCVSIDEILQNGPVSQATTDAIKHLYVDSTFGGSVLKIEHCPPSVRHLYPSYPRELNHHELQQLPLPIWFKSYLYSWREREDKYVLAHPAFHDEDRE